MINTDTQIHTHSDKAPRLAGAQDGLPQTAGKSHQGMRGDPQGGLVQHRGNKKWLCPGPPSERARTEI